MTINWVSQQHPHEQWDFFFFNKKTLERRTNRQDFVRGIQMSGVEIWTGDLVTMHSLSNLSI